MVGDGAQLRRAVAVISLGLIAVLAIALLVIPRPEPVRVPQGDALGPETGESLNAYQQRVARTAEQAPTGPRFGLVTFTTALEPATAGELTTHLMRVNAAVTGQGPAIALPEPVPGATRAQVFQRAGAQHIHAVVVYDEATRLEKMRDHPSVAVVEMLDSDAVWGTFAIRLGVSAPSY